MHKINKFSFLSVLTTSSSENSENKGRKLYSSLSILNKNHAYPFNDVHHIVIISYNKCLVKVQCLLHVNILSVSPPA